MDIKSAVVRSFVTNEEFIKHIAQLAADYSINPIVDDFAGGLWRKGKAREMYRFTRDSIKYVRDPTNIEKVTKPDRMIMEWNERKYITGDCDDKVTFLASLLLNKGYPVRIVAAHYFGEKGPPNSINHVYLEFQDVYGNNKERWIPLDASSNLPFGVKSSKVVPLKYFYPKPPNVSVGANIVEPAYVLSKYHTGLMHQINLITKKDIPLLKQVYDISPNDNVKNAISEALPLIEKHGYLTPEDARHIGAKNTHILLALVAPLKASIHVQPYEDILYPNVGIAPIIIAGIALFAIGAIIGGLKDKSWSAAVKYGISAVAIGAVVYLGWQYIPTGFSALKSSLGIAANNTSSTKEKNIATNTSDAVEAGGTVSRDQASNKQLGGDDKSAFNVDSFLTQVLSGEPISKKPRSLCGDVGNCGIPPQKGDETTEAGFAPNTGLVISGIVISAGLAYYITQRRNK